jgi:hypothetical protein
MSGHKYGGDCEQVVGKFPGVVAVRFNACWSCTENHEPCTCFRKDPLDKLTSVATQSVFVPNHNFCDSSLVYSLQKGFKPRPLEVETGADVRDDFVGGIGFLHVLDLALEITRRFLLGAGDSSVEDTYRFLFRGTVVT